MPALGLLAGCGPMGARIFHVRVISTAYPPLIRPSTPLPTHNDLKITMVSTTIIPLNTFLPSFTVFNPLAHDLGDRWVGEPEARCRAYRAPGEYFFATR